MIAGIAVSLSMTASEYLSTKSEGGGQYPIKASAYTGSAYVLTVILLILPYFLFHSYLASLGLTLLNAAVVTLVSPFPSPLPGISPSGGDFWKWHSSALARQE